MSFTLTSSPNELTRSLSGVVRCAVPLLVVVAAIGAPVGAAGLASVLQERVRFPLPGLPPPTADQRELLTACQMPRIELNYSVEAHNAELYPKKAERIETGWLVYDRYQEQLVQVDDQLNEVRRLGRSADGPMEYRDPAAFFSMAPDDRRIGVLDSRPPSFMWMDADGTGNEQRVDLRFPKHAVFDGERLTVTSSSPEGGIFEVLPQLDSVRALATWDDLGLSVSPDGRGQPPTGILRIGPRGRVHLGIVSQSSVWAPGVAGYRKTVQRCVPPVLTQLHVEAFEIMEGLPRVNIVSMNDFLVLPDSRILTLGDLSLTAGPKSGRSIEVYDGAGERLGAWSLPFWSRGMFDPSDPYRLLVWGGEIEGVQVVEVSSDVIW